MRTFGLFLITCFVSIVATLTLSAIVGCASIPRVEMSVESCGLIDASYAPNEGDESPLEVKKLSGDGTIEIKVAGIPTLAKWESVKLALDDGSEIECHRIVVRALGQSWSGALADSDARCLTELGVLEEKQARP
jgi:hypothetical protein